MTVFVDQLSDFVTGLSFGSTPDKILDSGRDRLLDAISTAVASRGVATTRAAVAAAELMSPAGGGDCTVLPTGGRMTAADAGLVNGTAVHAILFEDIDLSSSDHPGAVIVPAALAAAESASRVAGRPATMGDLIVAIVAGYEVHLRLGVLAAPGVKKRRLRTTAIFGTVGAAAAAASIFRLTPDRTAAALAMGANTAFGFLEGFAHGTMEPYVQAGVAARNGLLSTFLSIGGVQTGPPVFEGKAGYFQGFADLEPVERVLPDQWRIGNVTAKPYPISGGKIGSVDSAIAAYQQGLEGSRISRVTVRLPPGIAEFPGSDKRGPFTTMNEAQDSTQFCVSAALLGRPMSSLRTVMDEFADPEVSELTQVTTLVSEPGRPFARVEVELADGRAIVSEVDWRDRQVPTIASMSEKLRSLSAGRWPADVSSAIIDLVTGDPGRPVSDLSNLLRD
jgi:2-methylcitrate dehydratase PrpD